MTSLSLLALLALASPSPQHDQGAWFPFVLPWNDRSNGSVMDASDLNVKPAGRNGRILSRSGRFVEEKTGKRVRFFGTNLGAEAAFPSRADADAIAARMAKLGINLVRFHHLNNGWALNGGTVWKQGKTYVEIDPAQLDKLDYFIAALKKQGIYSNINLQTARNYVPELGFPSSVTELKNFAKKIDKVNRRMFDLQKQYARELIGRVNPHTGVRYADDPAIMKVEINNENSLVGWPGESPGAGLDGFPEPFRGEIVANWNRWLLKKYGTDAKLAEAWPPRANLGPSTVSRETRWSHENQGNGEVRFDILPNTGSADSAPTLVATVTSNPGPAWHVQAHVGGLTLENGKTYTVDFRAKASRQMAVGIDSRLNKPDWRFLGLGATALVGTEWKDFSFTFRAQDAEPNSARISFVLGDARGTLTVENFRIRQGEREVGLLPSESIEKGNLDLPAAGISRRFRDYTQFLAETEAAYSLEMRNFLRDELGFKNTNLLDTQVAWGGLTALVREKPMEFADAHEYWNHPTFLGSDWDPKNYRVNRQALVDEFEKGFGTLGRLAMYRIVGKPYSVSEYNHPAPSDFQVEMMPLYATFAAAQDWDAIYTFAWDATGSGVKNDMYENYFDMSRNPGKSAFFPLAARIFRSGLVAPLKSETFLQVPEDAYLENLLPSAFWSSLGRQPQPVYNRLGIKASSTPQAAIVGSTTRGLNSPFTSQAGTGGKIVKVDDAASKAVIGFIGGKEVRMNGLEVAFGKFGFDFGALLVASHDGKPLPQSARIGISLGGRFENQGMGWNADRTSVSDQWGKGPVQAEFIPATIRINVAGPRKVYALDPTGKRKQQVPSSFKDGVLAFQTQSNARTVWYEVAAK